MEQLRQIFIEKINNIRPQFQRNLVFEIDWTDRLIGIKGARGSGKTTLLLQYIKSNFEGLDNVLYVSLDEIYFSGNRLVDLATEFVQTGGDFLFLDEVHKYSNWQQEIKNIYDRWKHLKIVFTGSSLLELQDSAGDLSRRAVMYELHGLSFREFLNITESKNFTSYRLEEILTNHETISMDIVKQIRPLAFFDDYLKFGYYPYFLENKNNYNERLRETIKYSLEVELPRIKKVEVRHINKIQKLLYVLATNVPFKPNITKLSERIELSRITLLDYLQYLEDAALIKRLFVDSDGIGLLSKPDKLYLENPNLLYAINPTNVNKGTLRESFFYNQLSKIGDVRYPNVGDFLCNGYTFEIGGKTKTKSQIVTIENGFIVSDDIEYGFQNKIPLWLFGFLY
jgi:uncharacterized protein